MMKLDNRELHLLGHITCSGNRFMRLKKLRIIYVLFACGLAGCALENIAYLGFTCGDVEGIKLESGMCVDASYKAMQCGGCSDSDISKCSEYISKGVFRLKRCPKEYVCSTVKGGDAYPVDINLCVLRQSETLNCPKDLEYVCDRGGGASCEESCQYCDPSKYTCLRIVGSEDGDDLCSSGTRECRDDSSYICVNGKWTLDSKCTNKCDNISGRCIDLA